MSDLITDEVFSDGQQNVAASNMNGIVARARLQPDSIANKVASVTLNVADQILVLKTDNTLARARFDVIVNSTSSALPLADSTKNGALRQVSGSATDFVDGTNNCQPISNLLPPGVIVPFAGPNIPAGWLACDGTEISRTTYASLFAAIGTTYGAGDASTTFNLPNTTGKFIGNVDVLGVSGGANTATLSVANLPSHAHPITDVVHTHAVTESPHTHPFHDTVQGQVQAATGTGAWAVGTGQTSQTGTPAGTTTVNVFASGTNLSTTDAAGSGTALPILPSYLSMPYIIKY